MIDYIKGKIAEINPTEVVVECGGIGYGIMISLQSYDLLKEKSEATVYIHFHVREDDRELYGFATKDERELFKLLIGVNGVGVGTARMMLSTLSAEEIRSAILSEDIARIKRVKGLGMKTAQKIIIELKDKIIKGEGADAAIPSLTANNADIDEATRALMMLGFSRANITKAIQKVLKGNPTAKVEDLIKESLKIL